MVMAQKQEYDLILRIRPDLSIRFLAFDWNDLVSLRESPVVFAERPYGVHYGALLAGDQFAVGGVEPMRMYSETAVRAPKVSRFHLAKYPRALTGHVSLAQNCWMHGVDVRKCPIKFGSLEHPSPLSARVIEECLLIDSETRMDSVDRNLLTAIAADLRLDRQTNHNPIDGCAS
jgi:hypothetical protein